MGKRKERRLAAQSAAGRRVKLDLFAEPSGDLGASSTTDEVGGEGDSKIRAELPRSPTSSGKGPVNPLLLLGQYSDDELDEERGDRLDHVTKENLSTILDDQVKEASGEEDADTEISVHQDVSELRAEEENMESLPAPVNAFLEENGIRENASANPEELLGETDVAEKICVPGTSDTQGTEDSSSGWKMVLHEESNSYYYWNIVTGETSWVAPDVLSKGTELVPEQKAVLEAEEREDTSNLGLAMDDSGLLPNDVSISDQNVINGSVHDMEAQKEVDLTYVLNQKGKCNDVDASDAERGSVPVCADHGAFLPGNCGTSRQAEDVLPGSANKECANCGTRRMTDYEQQQTTINLSSRLVRHGEDLLGRLTSLKGSSGHDYQIVKLISEVEIRLHDMRSLISSRTSLLPLWLHSESQLKKLEAAIDDEVQKFCESATISENNAAQKSDEISHDNIKVNAAERKAVCSSPADADTFGAVSLSKELEKHSSNHPAVHSASVPSEGYLYSFSDSNARGIAIVACGTGMLADPKNELQTEDDVEMEVEMEVEDAVGATNTVDGDALRGQYDLPERRLLPHPPAQHESPLLEEGQIPPLPDDEWIPPPPPDDEPIPPPPPDEPPESVPPPPSEYPTVEQFSYADHYYLTYPGSGFEYYGQTHTEIPNGGFYVDANGCQTAAAHPQLYYAPVPTTYSAAASVIVNSVEPATYYTFQDASLSTAPTVTGIEPPGLQSTPGYLFLGTEQNGAVEAHKEVGFTPAPTIDAGASAVGKDIEDESREAPLISTSVQSSATNSITQVPVVTNPPISSVIASAEPVPKVPSKATRMKMKKKTVH